MRRLRLQYLNKPDKSDPDNNKRILWVLVWPFYFGLRWDIRQGLKSAKWRSGNITKPVPLTPIWE